MHPLIPGASGKASPLLPSSLAPPSSAPKTFVFDLETTGLMQAFAPGVRGDVGISQFALREQGTKNAYVRYTHGLEKTVKAYDAGEITADTAANILESVGPHGTRWQTGYKNRDNVLYGVLNRHVEMTRHAIAGRSDILAKESDLVSKMTGYLKGGHKIRGWNIDFDMLMMSEAAARTNPAVHQRWVKAVNFARQRGQIEDMASGVHKFMYLAAQESAMQGKRGGKEFFTLGQISKDVRNQIKSGKLSVDEIDKLSYDKIMEHHQGFKKFFQEKSRGAGVSYEAYRRYIDILGAKTGIGAGAGSQAFKAGMQRPDIRYAKGWSADVLLKALAPSGLKGSTLEKAAQGLIEEGKLTSHEALADTAYEEILSDIFTVKSGRYKGAWEEIRTKMNKYGLNYTQKQFFDNYKSAIEWKSKTQMKEVAQMATRALDPNWAAVFGEKQAIAAAGAAGTARAAARQPESLRHIYGKAYGEVSSKFRSLATKHPTKVAAAALLAGITIGEALASRRQEPIAGIRDPSRPDNMVIQGIYFGATGRGVARALTDFGSGRLFGNPVTADNARVQQMRSSLNVKYPERQGITYERRQALKAIWETAAGSARNREERLTREEYKTMRASQVKAGGLNSSAWVGVMDLKRFKVKVLDADTVQLERKSLFHKLRPRRVSVRLAGIDAPETSSKSPGTTPLFEQDQFAGKAGGEYLEKLIERQQSLRLVIDPRGSTYARNVGVLIGDRGKNLNLQLVRAGAASVFPGSNILNKAVFAETEAMAARGGVGMWGSKGWQMDRAISLIAGERVTHNTLSSADRIVKSGAMSMMYGLVQEGHRNSGTPYTRSEMQRMYQAGTSLRAEIMSRRNSQIKKDGYLPGIRKPVSGWHIAGYGINPSRMEGGNVSDFGSGYDVSKRSWQALAGYLNKANLSWGQYAEGLSYFESRNQKNRLYTKLVQASSRIKVPESVGLAMADAAGSVYLEHAVLGNFVDAATGNLVVNPGRARAMIKSSIKNRGISTPGSLPGWDPRFGSTNNSGVPSPSLAKDVRNLIALGRKHKTELGPMLHECIRFGQDNPDEVLVDWAKKGWEDLQRSHKEVLHTPPATPTATNAAIPKGESVKAQALVRTPEASPPKLQGVSDMALVTNQQLENVAIAQTQKKVLLQPRTATVPIPETMPPKMALPAPGPGTPQIRAMKDATNAASKEAVANAAGVTKGVKAASATHLKIGGGIAIGLGALWLGYSMFRGPRRDEQISAGMAMGPAYRSPNEFMAMQPYGAFHSSSKPGEWAEFQQGADPSDDSGKTFMMLGLQAAWTFFGESKTPLHRVWDHYYEAKGIAGPADRMGIREVSRFQTRLEKGLKKMGYSDAEVQVWNNARKTKKGFIAKLSKNLEDKNPIEKITEGWKGIPSRMMEWTKNKTSGLTKNFVQKATTWMKNFAIGPVASSYGLDVNKYLQLKEKGLLKAYVKRGAVVGGGEKWGRAGATKFKHASAFRQKVDAAKYLYKNLVKNPASWQAKVEGMGAILNNVGNLEQMMGAHIGASADKVKAIARIENSFTRIGGRLSAMEAKNPIFAAKMGKRMKYITGAGNKLSKFGVSKIGRFAGKVPGLNLAMGVVDGLSIMDQYDNAAAGFAIETTASTVNMTIQMAGLKVGIAAGAATAAAAGAALGSVVPGAGTVVGGVVGALAWVVGFAATMIGSMILGEVAAYGTRKAGQFTLNSRPKRTASPTEPIGQDQLFPAGGFSAIREDGLGPLQQFHAIDNARQDLSPFGGAYNPIRAQNINTRTLQISDSKRNIVSRPDAPRPISQFTPTSGLVNYVLWNSRHNSRVRSVVERYSHAHRRPSRDRNRSRMMARAA